MKHFLHDPGPAKAAEFISTVLAVLEGISQHPSLLVKHDQVVIETILPTVAELVGSQNGKQCIECFKSKAIL